MTDLYMADVTPLEEEARFLRLYETASEDRKRKIDALRFPKDKRLSLGAWLLLEKVLRQWGFEGEILLERNAYGKPFLKNHPELHFNLSHSGSRVMCALSRGEVGCDIQQMGRWDEKLAKRFFSPEEKAFLASESSEEAFFRLWCLKESFVKAAGRGLALPLRDFSILFEDDGICIRQSIFPERPFFFRAGSGNGYCWACCAGDAKISAPERIELI